MDRNGHFQHPAMPFHPRQSFQRPQVVIQRQQPIFYAPPPPPPLPPPQQFPQVEQYLVLWRCAEDYFASAQKLSSIAIRACEIQLLYKYHKLVLAGIKCLNAIFLLDTRRLPIKVEMHARLRLAEVLLKETENVDMAEDLLSKGILRIPKIPEFYDLKFAMQQLQASILIRTSFKAARAHIRTCLDEARDRERLTWEYTFLLTRLNHTIPNPDNHEITQHISTIHHLRTLAQTNADHEIIELSALLEIHFALLHNQSQINIDHLLTLAQNCSLSNPLRQQHVQLSLFRMLLHVLHLLRVGSATAAVLKLREHHQLMDFVVPKETLLSDGKFELLVCRGQGRVYFQWMGQNESFVVGYILSGMVYLPDSTNCKGIKFLGEGLKVIDSMFPQVSIMADEGMLEAEKVESGMWLADAIAQQERLLRLKRYTLLYLSFANLLRSMWDDANTSISLLQSMPSSSEDTVFTQLLNLLLGAQAQYHGNLQKAKEYYSLIPPSTSEIYIISRMNLALLCYNPANPSNVTASTKLLEEAERRIFMAAASTNDLNTVFPQLRAALNLIKGLTTPEIVKTHDLLSRAVHQSHDLANNQIKVLGLAGLTARYFINISTHEADKLGTMAYIAAQKANNELWGLITGNLLSEVYKKQDKLAKKEKQDSINSEIRSRAERLFNLEQQK